MKSDLIRNLIHSRSGLEPLPGIRPGTHGGAAEGGCGVIGIACSERIAARHLLRSLDQMRNRGNGKGGGIAAVGLDPDELGVSQQVLEDDYLLVIAYLDLEAREAVEEGYIHPIFEVDHVREAPQLADHTQLPGLDVRPPDVIQYFVRLKPQVVEDFAARHGLDDLPRRRVEDEVVYQNSYQLNREFYAATGDSQAFVLSHGKNMMVLKMVGYGDDVVRYYQLEDMHAHVWIGHHRYPTKGKVWHPGGAHPFVGLNEALVHNGDFANYASITEYLSQRNIHPLFLTDTEVSVLVFDLLHRVYDYPLEYVIEALAPTTERDFTLLPDEKRRIYHMLQTTHMHCSPDGPWFFLIAGSAEAAKEPNGRAGDGEPGQAFRLIGITDTSMLRPQVFAWQQSGEVGPAIGFAASEKQAIDAALESLAGEDTRFWPRADRYWNARGGSHTDGGAFIFTVTPNGEQGAHLVCTDKFGRQIRSDTSKVPFAAADGDAPLSPGARREIEAEISQRFDPTAGAEETFASFVAVLPAWGYEEVRTLLRAVGQTADTDAGRRRAIDLLSLLIDRRYPTGNLRRSSLLALYDECLADVLEQIHQAPSPAFTFTNIRRSPPDPESAEQTIVVDARGFAPEGPDSLALELNRLVAGGYRRILLAHTRGHRFLGNGMGPDSQGVRVDVFGSPGDYLASGIDGVEIHVHGDGQDQLAQIMKRGKLVVHGDVGQTFMYAAKGGRAFVLGNAAGRPLINAVGSPRVIINGTCLDYLAESFMAGDPLNGGGFVILNGITFEDGRIRDLDTPYPGGNLFSLASGGAIYIRDPLRTVDEAQLNGGEFASLSARDWAAILPYLEENERLFGIPLEALLTVDGQPRPGPDVYRKIQPRSVRALQAEEAWVRSEE